MTKGREHMMKDERGSAILTTVILLPVLIAFMELVVLGGRIAGTQADLNAAAREAARQASVAQSRGSAATVIGPVVDTALADKGLQCQTPTTNLGLFTNFAAGGRVEVTVTCRVQVSDLSLLSLPFGERIFVGAATEPIDTYRVVE